jgi:hypothetical protein
MVDDLFLAPLHMSQIQDFPLPSQGEVSPILSKDNPIDPKKRERKTAIDGKSVPQMYFEQ